MNICYFGNFDPNFSRNRIYITGLRQNGHIVHLIYSHARFPFNVVSLIVAYAKIKSKTDVMIVGYGSFLLVPLAKLIAGVPVVYDALCPLIDPAIFSRSLHKESVLHLWRARFFDWLTFKLSDLVLLESKAQKKFVSKMYSVSQSKLAVVYTGADNAIFFPSKAKTGQICNVVFRGKFLPEAGVEHILHAAKILEKEKIQFTLIGNGFEYKKILDHYNKLKLSNMTLITHNLTNEELQGLLSQADIMLGQFANNDRLNRTIPHKAYEAMAIQRPYLTINTAPNKEIFLHRKTAHLIPAANPTALSIAIKELAGDFNYRQMLARNTYMLYLDRFTPKKIGEDIVNAINTHF